MRSKARLALSVAALFLCFTGASPARSQAQDAASPKTATTPPAEVPPHTYRLDYTLTESEGGKKIDSRRYSLETGGGTNSGRSWSSYIESGTRVPVESKGDTNHQYNEYQYIDVGTKFRCSISQRDGAQVLDTGLTLSSVAPDATDIDARHPILRNLEIGNVTPIQTGKTTLVGSAEDPNSGRTFLLEVTVTEIK
jgi:hypothetical protein